MSSDVPSTISVRLPTRRSDLDGLGVERLARYALQFVLDRRPADIAARRRQPSLHRMKKATFGMMFLGTLTTWDSSGSLRRRPIKWSRACCGRKRRALAHTPRRSGSALYQNHVILSGRTKDRWQRVRQRLESRDSASRVAARTCAAPTSGSARPQDSPARRAGRVGERFPDGSYETHAWFSGFAPADNPEVAITVFLERGVGATNAAPLGAKILDYYYHRQGQQTDAGQQSPTGVTP